MATEQVGAGLEANGDSASWSAAARWRNDKRGEPEPDRSGVPAPTASADPPGVRRRERAMLEHLLARGADHGGCLVIHGEPGMGKSFLLGFARAEAEAVEARVLSVAGVECETHLAFAGLQNLLRPLVGGVPELPPPQRLALEVAFGIAEGPVPEQFLLGLAVLTLLGDSAVHRRVVMIVDDAQWLDQPTLEVLAFVARRVESDPIVLLAATRGDVQTALESAQLPKLDLDALDQGAARALLHAQAPDLAPSFVERVLSLAQGNPLALGELPQSLGSETARPSSQPVGEIAMTERLRQTFASRLAGMPSETRVLLLIAAVNDSDLTAETVAAAALMLGQRPADDGFEPAEAAELIELTTSRLCFRHPLVRSAIRQTAAPAQRRIAHGALSSVLADEDRRTWHVAAATASADEAVAGMLDQVATRAARRGALSVAAHALERAAALSETGARRGARLVGAAELALDVAAPETINRLAQAADPLDLDAVDRGRLMLISQLVSPVAAGEPASVQVAMMTAAQLSSTGHDPLALRLLWAAATGAFHVDADPLTRTQLVAACERLSVAADDPRLLSTIALAAPIETAATVIEHALRQEPRPTTDPDAMGLIGTALCTVGAAVLANGYLTVAADAMREAGRVRPLARVLALRSMAGFLQGSWGSAEADAAEAVQFGQETGQPVWAATALTAQALLASARGNPEAEALAYQAERLALPARARAALAMIQMARGLSALSAGRHDTAYHELRRMFDSTDLAHHSAKRGRAIGMLAEAAIQSGHRDDARALLSDVAASIEHSASPWQRLAVRHARALLAEDEDGEEAFEAALAADLVRWPFERARLQLAYGAWLRRRRRSADSRAPLRAARDTFEALGATPWSERAAQELRASGERTRNRAPEARDQLSPQELQIATLAATGLSNREIGEKLYLSHRTVASHLYRIFPKLGVTSRGELPAALAAGKTASATEIP